MNGGGPPFVPKSTGGRMGVPVNHRRGPLYWTSRLTYLSSMASRTVSRPAKSGFIEPCLPSTAAKPPNGDNWIHEIKLDGYRLMARRDAGGIRLLTRNGHTWTAKFPVIAAAVNRLKVRSCLIDGEAVCLDDDRQPDFNLLRRTGGLARAILFAFDLLELDGKDMRREPIEARKAALAKMLRNAPAGIALSEHTEGEASILFRHACRLGYEGIVSKLKGSRYRSGRSRDWIKTKNPKHPATTRVLEEDWS
jgi:bifunctional non-homologous end joining protein LigD